VRLRDAAGEDELALNLTSMSDIVFLMLVFFMLATTFADPERVLAVDLPPASASQEPPREELVIQVLEDGTFVLAGEELDAPALVERLTRAAASSRETPVTIRGHRRARHEAIVTVMDACRSAGLSNLSVGTSRDERG
jgi:biopolymer transport protein ExbD